ncbi:MAG: hypothetical protein AVDCRST_MAG44-734 [uncultured Sphingomonas sp.]|uniref:Uncharacterized protein n=1 Tax=uncultured Sphingomonas sp. TaxID=158754 RepID=A0A6J4SJW6_9SPHN|nr:MAG: hypothetical protein AVDCRST_MAG44-734 [uncultured Sphingomonas sp.]
MLTDFPPPPGFTSYESRPYDEDSVAHYERAGTAEEAALLDATADAEWQEERAY